MGKKLILVRKARLRMTKRGLRVSPASVRIGRKTGVNLSRSDVSVSTRTRFGTINSKRGCSVPLGIFLIFVFLLVVLFVSTPVRIFASQGHDLPPGDDARVLSVIDGDTAIVDIHGTQFTITYLGIDAPEGRPSKPADCFAKQAKAYNTKLIAGKQLRLERDTSDFDVDGRLQRYAYLPDGQSVNELLLRGGFAMAVPSSTDTHYTIKFADLQAQAIAAKAGMWGACPSLTPVTEAAPQPIPASVAPVVTPSVATRYGNAAYTDTSKSSVCGMLEMGQRFKTTGKSPDGLWWQIEWPGGLLCWVQKGLVDFIGSEADIPVITPQVVAPPPPALPQSIAPPQNSGSRSGAICRDGSRSTATGRGACSHHGGVASWLP